MEFLVVFLPLALVVDFGWLWVHLAHRRLVDVVRARQPALLDELRGRPRRGWYDPSDASLVQQRSLRKKFRERVAPLAARDAELQARLAEVDAAERVLRVGALVGGALTLVLIIWMVIRFG